MPIYPLIMEVRDPIMKATVVKGKLTSDGSTVKNNRIENKNTNPNKKVYSYLRKVIAPSSISFDIPIILSSNSFPLSDFS